MTTKPINPNSNKNFKYSRTLNINKNKNLKIKSKSNTKIERKLIKPIKIKNINKLKENILNKKITEIKNEKKEKEIDASIDDNIYKEEIPPIMNNPNKSNINTLEKKYIKINNKTPNKIIKTIKTQLISNTAINNANNVRNYSNLINGGNMKNIHGKLNLNITLNNKSPVRLRKFNMNKKYDYGVNCLSTYKKEKQINTIFVNNNKNMNMDLNMNIYNNDITSASNNISNIDNKDELIIINLKEEIENQKRENLYKEMVINDMKKQLDDINRDKENKILNGNFINTLNEDIYLLKKELNMLNNKVTKDINYASLTDDKNYNKEEAILFDKLKTNYSKNKSLINNFI